MKASIEYTEREQTPAQRQELIDAARAWNVAQGATPGPEAEAVYARYVAGELSLQGVTDELVSFYRHRSLTKAIQVNSASVIDALDKQFSQPVQQRQMQPELLEIA